MKNKIEALSAQSVSSLMKFAKDRCPDIALGMMLQAYAGLRSGEICLLRNSSHARGSSVIVKGREVYISFGLKANTIPDDYTEIVKNAYDLHCEYINNRCIDARQPLFINANGTALSADGYIRRVKAFGNCIAFSKSIQLLEARGYILEAKGKFTGDLLRLWYEAHIMQSAIRAKDNNKQ